MTPPTSHSYPFKTITSGPPRCARLKHSPTDLWSNAITVCESASIRDVYSTASIIPSAFTITCETSIRSF
ncbi:unnamed protein product [Aureobasidium pullulans]|nr:unnamed protein product [Aureobasidium pullulans]